MSPKRLTNGYNTDSDNESDSSRSESEDSSNAVSRSNVKATARKSTTAPVKRQGRQPKSKPEQNKRQRMLNDVSRTSVRNSHNSQDDDSGNVSAQKKKLIRQKSLASKRGRLPKQAKNQKLLGSDDESRPSTSGINLRNNGSDLSDDVSDASSTDTVCFGSTNKRAISDKNTTVKKRGRPPNSKTSINNSRDLQPSTSNRNGIFSNEDGRESPVLDISDDDYIPASRGGKNKTKNKKDQRSSPSKKTNPDYSINKISRLSQVSKDTTCDPSIVENLAQKCVYFLLVEDQNKHAIKRKAIVQHVFKDEHYSAKLYTAVICEASKILMKTFGMEIFTLENQKDSYMIVNSLKKELGIEEYIELSQLKHQQNGLILYLLTVIFMNGNSITEDELNKALKPLRIDLPSRKLHPIFGDVKKYITIELVKQMYLTYECINKDPPQFEIKWGLRAKQELDKKDILDFASQVLDTTPENWILQFRDAEQSSNTP